MSGRRRAATGTVVMGPRLRGDDTEFASLLEKTGSRILGRALLRHCLLQPLDLRIQQRDALGEFLDRQQIQILPDLVGDLLPWLVVILGGHVACSRTLVWLIR